MNGIGSWLKEGLLRFLFPPFCWHCGAPLGEEEPILCADCWRESPLLSLEGRCPRCFAEEEAGQGCASCALNPIYPSRVGAAFAYGGPIVTLVHALKFGDRPQLAEGLGRFMAIQLDRLGWGVPDLICPVPLSPIHRIVRGYNQAELLAHALGDCLAIPVEPLIKRLPGDFSQAGQRARQRRQLSADHFSLCSQTHSWAGKRLLLVDDVQTTGATLNCCAQILREAHPCKVWALSLCAAGL